MNNYLADKRTITDLTLEKVNAPISEGLDFQVIPDLMRL